MAKNETLHDAFIDELRDAYDAERQILKALPKMAKNATAESLQGAFETHLEETRDHVTRLEQVFTRMGEKVRGTHCDGVAGIIDEAKALFDDDFDPATLDACLIAAAQRVEHYEMAAYGTLVAWARTLGHLKEADVLASILEEEKAADQKLNMLAESGINLAAAPARAQATAPLARAAGAGGPRRR